MQTVADHRQELLDRIARAARRAGRSPQEIQLVAVSKTVGPECVRDAWKAGQSVFGESRAQELSAKMRALADLEIEWHFIGYLQTNKVRLVIPGAALIHSVDRPELAAKIARRASPDRQQPVLVQVNTTSEETKSGVAPERLPALLDGIAQLPNLRVDGLMTIGPLTGDVGRIRAAFQNLRELLETERARQRPGAPLRHLSMGMSGDLEIAIEEGATIVRVGTALFGSRPTP